MPGAKLDQRIEIRSIPPVQLRHQSLQRMPLEDPGAAFAHGAHIGKDRHLRIQVDAALLPDQPERTAPAQPDLIDMGRAAPDGTQRYFASAPPFCQVEPGLLGIVVNEKRA